MKRTRVKNLPDVDESTLVYAVLHGKDTSARCAALKKIVNVEPIVDDLLHDEDDEVRSVAAERYEQIDKHDRSRAVERTCDAKALVYIATRYRCIHPRRGSEEDR